MKSLFDIKASGRVLHQFLESYFKDLSQWKKGVKAIFDLDLNENLELKIYDEEYLYETWTLDEMEDYLDDNYYFEE